MTTDARRAAPTDRARARLDTVVEEGTVPGVQYLVVDSASVIFEYAGGWADLAGRRPMDPSTTLMAHSMSKTITAAAVLRLADEGALALDDPVSRYVEAAPARAATIDQLLTHTGGVPNPIPLRWVHLVREHAAFDERAALDEQYSFLNFVKRLVLDGRFIGRYRGRWLEIAAHYVDGPAFGGLVGTAGGFGRFLQDQLGPRSALFGDATRALMYRPARTKGGEIPMTHGWHIESLGTIRYFYKEGGGGGFHSMMRLYPERGIGTVVMTNATVFDVAGLLDRLDRAFLTD